jgi:hypothetical protein
MSAEEHPSTWREAEHVPPSVPHHQLRPCNHHCLSRHPHLPASVVQHATVGSGQGHASMTYKQVAVTSTTELSPEVA